MPSSNTVTLRMVLSVLWALGLLCLFAWGLPVLCWSVAQSLGSYWLVLVPVAGCVYAMHWIDQVISQPALSERFPWAWLVKKLENPFQNEGDAKGGAFLIVFIIMTLIVLLSRLFFNAILTVLQ